MRRSSRVLGVALAAAVCATLLIWYAAGAEDTRGRLTVTFLPGGEIFVVTPGGDRILIDGGNQVLRELGSVMPLYDRSLDLLVERAPGSAASSGLTDVLSRYTVGFFGESSAQSGAPQEASFVAAVTAGESHGMRVVELSRGAVVDFGDGAYLETLFPDRDASLMSASDGCLIFKLIYGNTSFLLSCSSPAIESYVAQLDGNALRTDVVFARSDASPLFVGFSQAQFVVSADSCGTQASTSSVFERLGESAFSACDAPITFVSDARTVVKE